jgi:hypothetical protein
MLIQIVATITPMANKKIRFLFFIAIVFDSVKVGVNDAKVLYFTKERL